MKKVALLVIAFLPLYWSCGNDNGSTAADRTEGDVDAAREFIRSALEGRWKDAQRLIVQDSANIEDLEVAEQNYTQRMTVIDQRGYREAQIRIHDTRKVSDSISVIAYSNTYKNKRDSVKVVQVGGRWLVDLKYSFPQTNAIHQ
jgi:hypothetical protein